MDAVFAVPIYATHHHGGLALGTLLSHGSCQQEGSRVRVRDIRETQLPPNRPRVTPEVEELPAGNWALLQWERMLATATSSPLLLQGQILCLQGY